VRYTYLNSGLWFASNLQPLLGAPSKDTDVASIFSFPAYFVSQKLQKKIIGTSTSSSVSLADYKEIFSTKNTFLNAYLFSNLVLTYPYSEILTQNV
jgi:hypothetical protein